MLVLKVYRPLQCLVNVNYRVLICCTCHSQSGSLFFILASSFCKSLQCLVVALTQGGEGGHLFRLTCSVVLWVERDTANKYRWRVWGSGRSVWTTLGLPQLKVACASWAHTAQAPGCSAGARSKADPASRALPRSKLLGFLGTPLGHRLCWVCVLCPSQVRGAQATRCLVSSLSQVGRVSSSPSPVRLLGLPGAPWERRLRCAVCLLWGADLRLWPSWQMSTVQDPRKMRLATGSLLTVWWRMPVSGFKNTAAPSLLVPAVACLPLCLRRWWWQRLGAGCTQLASCPLVFTQSFVLWAGQAAH